MTNDSTVTTRIVGLDLGDRESVYVVMAGEEVVKRGRVATATPKLEGFFGGLEPTRVVLEVGTHSPWVSRLLKRCGHEVLVLNPRRLAIISKSLQKSDREDAETLALMGQLPLAMLCPVQHRSEQAQADLEVLRGREALVGARTLLVNHVRGALKAMGIRVRACDTRSFPKYASMAIPQEQQAAYAPLLASLIELNQQIAGYDRKVVELARERYPETGALQQIPGVGPLTALTMVLTIEDPQRFRRGRQVGAYLGLVPARRQSGGRDPKLGITRAGDKRLRTLLVQCAHYILGYRGPDSDLRRWGLALAERRGKMVAIVAVARKLSALLHHLWVTGEVYRPLGSEEGAIAAA